MKHIENYIANSWSKVPADFKNRVEYNITAGIKAEASLYGITFNNEEIDRRLQKEVDKILVDALSKFYGFTEIEANKLLRKMN